MTLSSTRRWRAVIVMVTADEELVQRMCEAIRRWPLDLVHVRDPSPAALTPAMRSGALLCVVDVDAPGAWDFIAIEERPGGVLQSAALVVISARPIAHAWDDDESAPARPWAASLPKPVDPAMLRKLVDREIAYECYEPRVTAAAPPRPGDTRGEPRR